MEILSCQSAINEAVQPGGPLVNDKWYISSLPMHDFLLAATILSILVLQMVGENTAGQTHKDPSKPTQQEMINALERSYSIWRQMQDISPDTKKAFGFLGSLLKKIRLAMAPINGLHNTGNINPFSINDFDPSANLISGLSMHGTYHMRAKPFLLHNAIYELAGEVTLPMNCQLTLVKIPSSLLKTKLPVIPHPGLLTHPALRLLPRTHNLDPSLCQFPRKIWAVY